MENYHRGIFPYLRNVTAVIVPDLKLETTIINNNTGKIVKKVTKKNVQMAPNSVFKYPILTGANKLQAGQYHLHMIVKNHEHQWVFNKDFTISATVAQKYNKQSVDNSGISIWWLIGLGALVMFILMLLILWLILVIRKRRQRSK